MIRNVVIAGLAAASVVFGYQLLQAGKTAEIQAQLIIETRDKAEKELQVLRDKLAAEEKERQLIEKDAKAVSAKLAEEQTARESAEQSAKASSERLTQVQNALANAEQSLRSANEAQAKAQKERDEMLEAWKAGKPAPQQKPAG
jgi:hypothetical protein